MWRNFAATRRSYMSLQPINRQCFGRKPLVSVLFHVVGLWHGHQIPAIYYRLFLVGLRGVTYYT